ncbi:MAG: FG-GAP-like repeat-containing protein [Pyrinomonadaceae bacterium]
MSLSNIRVRVALLQFVALLWLCLLAHSTLAERPDVVWMRSGIPQGIRGMDYSPDGQFLATSEFAEIKLWRFSDRQLIRTFSTPCILVGGIRFAPDGLHIVFACSNNDGGSVRRLRLSDGVTDITYLSAAIGIPFQGNGWFGFMPGGDVAIGMNLPNGSLRFFDFSSGVQVGSTLTQISYTQSGQTFNLTFGGVSSFSNTGLISVYRIVNFQLETYVINRNGTVLKFGGGQISPDGALIGSGNQIYTYAQLCGPGQTQCNQGPPLFTTAGYHQNGFSPDHQYLGTYNGNASTTPLLLYNTSTGNLFHTEPHEGVLDFVFSPDSQSITAQLRVGGSYTLWNRSLLSGAVSRLETFYQVVDGVSFSPDGGRVATISTRDLGGSVTHAVVRIFDTQTSDLVHSFSIGAVSSGLDGNRIQYSPDGTRLFVRQNSGGIQVWQTSDYQLVRTLPGSNTGFAVSPDGTKVALATGAVYDVQTGSLIRALAPTFGSAYVTFRNDDEVFVTDRLYRISTGALIRTFTTTGLSTVYAIDVSPNGERVVFAGTGQALVRNINDGSLVLQVPTSSAFDPEVEFTPDGNHFFTGGQDGVRVWNVASGSLAAFYDEEVSHGGSAKIYSLDISQNGTKFAYGRYDGTLVIANNPFVDASIQLGSATYTIGEAAASAQITVTRTFSSNGTVTVDYATSNGTATAGSDYTSTSGTLTWNDGDGNSKTISIPITDDSAVEADENFTITLSNPTGPAGLGTPASAVVTIADNDVTPTPTPVPCLGTPTFMRAPAVSFTEQYQAGLAFADFNEDGKQDIAFSTENPGAMVTVRLGDGAGGFTGNLELTDAPSPWGLKTADVNNDGNQDIVAANPRVSGVSVWLGNGTGGFGTASLYLGFGGWNSFVETGDLNNDGNVDIISPAPNNAGTLFGTGGGNFAPVVHVPVGSTPVGVAVSDLDLDGDLDFVTANYGAGTLSVRMGNGAGGFANAPDIAVGAGAYWVKTGNFNGDAYPDLAVTNRDADTVSILLNNGTGGFTAARDVPTPSHPTGLAVGDLNNDGKDDIVAAPYDSNALALFLGNGAGRFTSLPSLYIDYNSHLVALADLNNDGTLDLATGNNGGFQRMSRVYLGGCTPTPTPTPPPPPPTGVCVPTLTVTEVNSGSLAWFEAVSAGPGSVTVNSVDSGRGLQGLTLVSSTNANVSIPSFPLGTYNPVTAAFTVPDPGQPADFTLRASSGRSFAVLIRAQCPAAIASGATMAGLLRTQVPVENGRLLTLERPAFHQAVLPETATPNAAYLY